MNKNNRFVRIVIAAVLTFLMAGASTQTLLTALGLPCGVMGAYLPALIAALLCGVGSLAGAAAVGAWIAAAALGGVVLVFNLDGLSAACAWVSARMNPEAVTDAQMLAQAGSLIAVALSALLGACIYAAVSRPGTTPLALLIHFAIMIGSYALIESMSFGPAVPGLIAALAAFALSCEVPRDAGAWRTLIPTALVVALALLMLPSDRLTWEPLERAANTVRSVFEDYFRFTHERIPFTISTEGYNHAAEIDGEVTPYLGGPAVPSEENVMSVTSDRNVLLRGSIRRTYTGHSWEDADAKARYLFRDFTRGRIRDRVFGMSGNEAFGAVNVSVDFLRTGTSSLFVPARLEEIELGAENALYYNSIGEIFLSRQVEAGDSYSLTGYQVDDEELMRQAVIDAVDDRDSYYDDIAESCLQLPMGIEEGVYTLAIELTANADNPYDKAAAIESWLRGSCVYTLTPEYPSYDRDFVSQFVMDSREGYCSYFASAMTVMCRIAGLPARYVEGYSVKAGQDVVVTGEDAHAWTEVYFNGIGWVAFDPANGSGGYDNNDNGFDDDDTADDEEVAPTEAPTPTPEPTATPEPDEASPPPEHPEQPEVTPTPEPEENAFSKPPEWPDEPEADDEKRDSGWLWMLLISLLILILLALAALWARMRLAATDAVKLSARATTGQQAVLILYRACLTLLRQTGLIPLSGETPSAFARRVNAQVRNPEFVAFSDAVARSVYSRGGADERTIECGRRAYAAFEKGLKRGERAKFTAVRLMKGLGEFESIP